MRNVDVDTSCTTLIQVNALLDGISSSCEHPGFASAESAIIHSSKSANPKTNTTYHNQPINQIFSTVLGSDQRAEFNRRQN